MKSTVLLSSVFCGLAFFSLAPLQGDGPIGGDTRFVDINEVIRNYEKAKREQESLQKSFAPQVAEFQKREEDLARKKKELAPLDRSSQEFFQKSTEIELEQMKIQREGEFLVRERDRKRAQMLVGAYEDIRGAVKKFAEANKLRAVLSVQKDLTADMDEDLKEKLTKINFRQVLYYDASLDVTPQIVKILNAQ